MSVIFNNLTIEPIGNAQVAVVNNKLVISNIGNSGLDGAMIHLPNKAPNIFFDLISYGTNGSIRKALLGNDNGNIYTMSESYVIKDPNTNFINYAYNFSYIADDYDVVGYKNNVEIFRIPGKNPKRIGGGAGEPKPGFVIALATVIIAIATVIIAAKPSTHLVPVKEYYPNGNLKKETFKILEDPSPIDVTVAGQTYNVDHWGVEWSNSWADSDNIQATQIAGLELTAADVSTLTIEQITLV